MSIISDNLDQVREQIRTAARQAGRNPDDVSLLAVSKTRPAEDIEAAYAAGQSAFGENYLQDALTKISRLKNLPLEWHFIGAIQSNKTREIAEHFDWVHTIEREKIARRLSEQRPAELPALNVCLQVNISGEVSKAGLEPAAVAEMAAAVAALPRLKLRGLMAIPASQPDPEKQRIPFRALADLQQALIENGLELDTLSMGMSGDLDAAIAEGASIVRIGTAIFGSRQP
jgi:pyridoxal phosphate enzyme (YggS family)